MNTTTTRKEPATTEQKVAAVREWSRRVYERNYGASVIEECMSDAEVAEMVAKARTTGGAVTAAKDFARLHSDACADACAEIF